MHRGVIKAEGSPSPISRPPTHPALLLSAALPFFVHGYHRKCPLTQDTGTKAKFCPVQKKQNPQKTARPNITKTSLLVHFKGFQWSGLLKYSELEKNQSR